MTRKQAVNEWWAPERNHGFAGLSKWSHLRIVRDAHAARRTLKGAGSEQRVLPALGRFSRIVKVHKPWRVGQPIP